MADPCVPRQALVGEEDLGAQRTREGAGWLPLAVLQLGVHVQLALGPELLGTNSARMVWSFVDELVLLQVPPGLELFVTDCTVSWVLVAAPDVLSKLSSRSDGLGALVALEARLHFLLHLLLYNNNVRFIKVWYETGQSQITWK